MREILWFREIDEENKKLAGEIGKNFGKLVNESFPVPPGFIVTTKALTGFLARNSLSEKIAKKINSCAESEEALEKASNEITEMIMEPQFNAELRTQIRSAYMKLGEKKIAWLTSGEEDFVSVRVSPQSMSELNGTAFSKQHNCPNVKGLQALIKGIKECWASLFSLEKIQQAKKEDSNFPETAIIVQKMPEADQSGVIYTNHSSKERDEVLIKACYGVSPIQEENSACFDRYVLEKGSLKLLAREVNEQNWMIERSGSSIEKKNISAFKKAKQKIQDKTIVELAKLGKQIEKLCNHSQEVLFAVEKHQLFVLQTSSLVKEFEEEQEKIVPIEIIDNPKTETKIEEPGKKENQEEENQPKEKESIPKSNAIELPGPGEETEYCVIISSPSEVWLVDEFIKEGAKEIVLDLDRFVGQGQEDSEALENQLRHLVKECRDKKLGFSVMGENKLNQEMKIKLSELGVKKIIAHRELLRQLMESKD